MDRQEYPPAEAPENKIKIDTSLIPDYVRDRLAAATLEAYLAFIRIPGNKEYLDKKTTERMQRK